MARIDEIVAKMRGNPKGIRYRALCKACDFYIGEARQTGCSHRIDKMPWPGDPRVDIQNAGGTAKAYQVKQVFRAIDRLETYGDVKE